MKTKNFKRPIALFLAVMLCASLLFSLGTTAFAAEETANVCLIAFPRDGDANYNGEWGHGNLNFMNGWSTKASSFTLIRAMGQYSGNICYCIEPGVSQQPGDSLTKKGEDFWDNYPAAYNKTISPEDIKLLIGRIFQYGYTGPISVSWRSQNDGGDKLAHAVATQLLIWETVVGERDADFNKIGTNGKDAIVDQISTNHPLYGQIMGYYSSIAANVQYHSSIPSFLAKTAAEAQSASLEWDGDAYAVTLTDKIENLCIGEYVVSEVSDGASSAYVLPADKTASVFEGAVTKVEMHNELRDTPKTGDDSNPVLWLALLGVSAAGAAALGVAGFRKRRKEDTE